MATRLKLFAGLFVLICILQVVLMAPEQRFRRDEPSDETHLSDIFKNAETELKKFLSDENTKKFIDAASNALNDIAKGFENQLEKLDRET